MRLFSYIGDSPLYNFDRRPSPSANPPDVLSLNLTTPFQNMQLQQQEQVQVVDSSTQYLESRSTAIESIESTLQELGGIFQQLAQMVSEQRDMVQRYGVTVYCGCWRKERVISQRQWIRSLG
jgi:syntaxin 5